MITVLAGGDSFIFGNELQDWIINPRYNSEHTFAALLAKEYNFTYRCCARPGNSNDAIMRMTINEIEVIHDKLVVIVAWSFPPRFEFPFTFPIDSPDSPFATISVWPESNRPVVRDFAKNFVKNVQIDWYQHFKTVQSIILLQSYLKLKNINYFFTCADNSVFHDYNSTSLKPYFEMIDYSNWFFFPEAHEEYNTKSPRGFYQWAVENKYECGPQQHPLEQAHKDAAHLMRDKFNELVKKIL